MKIKLITLALLIIIGFGVFSITSSNQASNNIIGSNNKGFVVKETYASSDASGHKIAVITGMHPREISAKNVVPEVIKDYSKEHNVEIVNYQINVTDQPGDFKIGRQNGESLVAQYVIPDIKKSNYDLVIICHNHVNGYGNGYYIATPTMDNKSVELAQSTHNLLLDFNYYQRNASITPEQSSINGVDYPIVATGTPVFVYEIPGLNEDSDVYSNTTQLIDSIFKILN